MAEPDLTWSDGNEDPDVSWDDLCEALTELMTGHTQWHGRVENFGWQGTAGEKDFTAATGKELLAAVLPKTDCTFNIFHNEDGSIHIQNFHHDSPTGKEYYYLNPTD
jgi:hypothetical protein